MQIDKMVVGDYQTNCYILTNNNNCIIIDPGDEFEKIKEFLKDKNVVAILITHKHFDHIGALDDLSNTYNCKVYEYNNLEEKDYNINDFNFNVIYTKGHTDDSVTFYFENKKVMFTGDFLFENSIGRTDLPTGNFSEMLKSIELIKKYDDDIIIYPGHGNQTKLGLEKTNNYWFDSVNQ